jgi:hypothetical protein
MFNVMLVNQNGIGWHETFKELKDALAYQNEYINKGFYVVIHETDKISNSYHYAGD